MRSVAGGRLGGVGRGAVGARGGASRWASARRGRGRGSVGGGRGRRWRSARTRSPWRWPSRSPWPWQSRVGGGRRRGRRRGRGGRGGASASASPTRRRRSPVIRPGAPGRRTSTSRAVLNRQVAGPARADGKCGSGGAGDAPDVCVHEVGCASSKIDVVGVAAVGVAERHRLAGGDRDLVADRRRVLEPEVVLPRSLLWARAALAEREGAGIAIAAQWPAMPGGRSVGSRARRGESVNMSVFA